MSAYQWIIGNRGHEAIYNIIQVSRKTISEQINEDELMKCILFCGLYETIPGELSHY